MTIIKGKIELLPQSHAIPHLIARLPATHPQIEFLANQHHRKTAGERGESKLQKKFREFHLEEDYLALWDTGLKLGEWINQFDGLVVTEKCVIILESKNISDELHFDEKTGEFIKTNAKGQRLVLENPIFQLNKNIRFLEQWFKQHKLSIPVKGLIVFTAGNCLFHSKPTGAPLCKTYQMNEYLYRILQTLPQDSTPLKINKIKRLIESNHTPYVRKPLCETYQIAVDDLRKGVYCANCRSYQMVRHKRNWVCRNCNSKNAAAHHLALQEYFTFVDGSITNKELRAFCLLESEDIAKRILRQYDFVISGETKARRYHIRES